MKAERIELVSYTKGEEILNVITHATGLLLPVFILIKCVPLCKEHPFALVCACLYALGTAMTFLASVIYHSLKNEKYKRLFRVIDHSAIFFAVAGTVTGCVPSVFQHSSALSAVLMLIFSWGSVITGLILTIFYFERFKAIRMGLYIFSSAFCSLLGVGSYFHLPIGAFLSLITGSTALLIGCVFLRIGAKKRYIHSVFHVFIVFGLAVYCYGIYNYTYLLL